jgi:hypothetical protein
MRDLVSTKSAHIRSDATIRRYRRQHRDNVKDVRAGRHYRAGLAGGRQLGTLTHIQTCPYRADISRYQHRDALTISKALTG